ncbi:MAG: hypothetical protein AABY22_26245, partial [Nanoarchaeota archaeon]
MNKIRIFIEKIENSQISLWAMTLLIFVAMFIRTFLENYSNSLNLYHMSGFIDIFFHYPLWFSVIFLSILIVVQNLTKENIGKIAKMVSVFSFVLIIPPIVDLIFNKGNQIPYLFIVDNYWDILKSFFTYFGGKTVGLGIKTEVAIALIGLGVYIFQKTKNIKRSLLGIILLYSIIFIMLALPTFVFGLKNIVFNENLSVNKKSVVDFWYNQESQNAVLVDRTFVLDRSVFSSPLLDKVNQSSVTFSIILLIINVFLL